jgi:hypothetical protein
MTTTDWLTAGVHRALAETEDAVDRWRQNEPGAWGHIAGQAVLACRGALGRPLTHAERRAVWAEAWRRLQHDRFG